MAGGCPFFPRIDYYFMDIAVVTGASSGLGLAISRKLLSLGFRVYGLGGNYNESPLQNVEFRPIPCDLTDPGMVEHKAREILGKEDAVCLLVNNAKLFSSDGMGESAGGDFARSLNVNLLCPLILIRCFLPGLKRVQGKVITISSATPETSRGGPVGAAAAGGLRWMHEVLFQEFRDHGVTFSTISPEPNRWRPADAPMANGDRPQSAIDPQVVADALGTIVQNDRANVITEVVIRPERLVEKPIPPMREVPYPKPKPIPYTVPRELIEAEEQLDREAEDEERSQADTHEREAARAGEPPREGPKKRRRRRRRRRDDDGPESEARPTTEPSSTERPDAEQAPREEREETARRPDSRGPEATRNGREDRRADDRRGDRRAATEREDRRDPARKEPAGPDRPTEVSTDAAAMAPVAAGFGSRRRKGRKPRPPSRQDRPVETERRPGPIDGIPEPKSFAERSAAAAAKASAGSVAGESRVSPQADPAPADQKKPVQQPVKASPPPANKEAAPAKKGARKTPGSSAKKAVKKTATKKAAVKKTAVKKAVKKVAKKATKRTTTKKVAQKAAAGREANRVDSSEGV